MNIVFDIEQREIEVGDLVVWNNSQGRDYLGLVAIDDCMDDFPFLILEVATMEVVASFISMEDVRDNCILKAKKEQIELRIKKVEE